MDVLDVKKESRVAAEEGNFSGAVEETAQKLLHF